MNNTKEGKVLVVGIYIITFFSLLIACSPRSSIYDKQLAERIKNLENEIQDSSLTIDFIIGDTKLMLEKDKITSYEKTISDTTTIYHFDESQRITKKEIKLKEYKISETLYYENGSLKQFSEFKNGLPHGLYLYFFPSGELQVIGNSNKGKMDGKYELYDSTGNLLVESIFLNDSILETTYY